MVDWKPYWYNSQLTHILYVLFTVFLQSRMLGKRKCYYENYKAKKIYLLYLLENFAYKWSHVVQESTVYNSLETHRSPWFPSEWTYLGLLKPELQYIPQCTL